MKYRVEQSIIRRSATHLFDHDFYIDGNEDVASYPGGPLVHFIKYGWREGRNPHILFDMEHYCGQIHNYPKNVNPLVHFHLVGRRKQISPSRWFYYDAYQERNRDIAFDKIEPFEHFVRFGVFENRDSSDLFDAREYYNRNSDVRESGMPGLYHYLQSVLVEGHPNFELGDLDKEYLRAMSAVRASEETRQSALQRILDLKLRQQSEPIVDVIVPVFRDYYLTLTCIESVLLADNETPSEVVVVDDCSPEPALSNALENIAAKGLIKLIKHKRNSGFVKSANEAMRLNRDRDIILLNSDTEVYGNWIDRLRQTANNEPKISTVCPLTNSGTICSYPKFPRDNSIPLDVEPEELDALAARVNAGSYVPTPTAVGFCMYIKRGAIEEVGYFDESAFGTGYGEENDFCIRAQKAGWRDVIAVDTFVKHSGSASFLGQKAERVSNAINTINRRYPGYDARIQTYIKDDPAAYYRAALDEARLQRLAGNKNKLLATHNRGGGTEQHVRDQIKHYEKDRWSVFRLSPDPAKKEHVRLGHAKVREFPNTRAYCLSKEEDLDALAARLQSLGISGIEIHHLVDFGKDAPQQVIELASKVGAEYSFVVHDYMTICPRLSLLGGSGDYCGEPAVSGCKNCLQSNGSDFGQPDIGQWRNQFKDLLNAAQSVVVPNDDVKQRLSKYFQGVSMTIKPHDEVVPAPFLQRPDKASQPIRVGTIGAISNIKGLNVLRACAKSAARKKMPLEYVVVGYTSNDAESKRAGLQITGAYANNRIAEEIENAQLDCIFLASVVPETFSYTLSIAMKTGLPIIGFDIGAIQNRLRYHYDDTQRLILPLNKRQSPEYINEEIVRFVRNFNPTPGQSSGTLPNHINEPS